MGSHDVIQCTTVVCYWIYAKHQHIQRQRCDDCDAACALNCIVLLNWPNWKRCQSALNKGSFNLLYTVFLSHTSSVDSFFWCFPAIVATTPQRQVKCGELQLESVLWKHVFNVGVQMLQCLMFQIQSTQKNPQNMMLAETSVYPFKLWESQPTKSLCNNLCIDFWAPLVSHLGRSYLTTTSEPPWNPILSWLSGSLWRMSVVVQ